MFWFLIFKCIYRFQIIIPCQTKSWQWFLFFCRLCLCLLIASLALQKLLSFTQSLLSVLGTVPCTIGVLFSESHLHFKVFLVLYSCNFRQFSLILRPSFWFYRDVCTEKCGFKFILLYVDAIFPGLFVKVIGIYPIYVSDTFIKN